jgi:hypothetical protein
LRRLRTDLIDLYQVHWPDPLVPVEETAAAMAELLRQGRPMRLRQGAMAGLAAIAIIFSSEPSPVSLFRALGGGWSEEGMSGA